MRKILSVSAAVALLALPAAGSADIVINEIMYDPISSDNSTQSEWIELYNTDSAPVSLEGWTVEAGNFENFVFPAGATIAGNGFIILQSFETDTFVNSYMQGVDPSIVYRLDVGSTVNSKLGNQVVGGTISILDNNSVLVDTVNYRKDNGWPTSPNDAENKGYSLELVDPTLDNSDGANWLVSRSPFATPGKWNSQAGATWYFPPSRTPQFPDSSDAITFNIGVTSTVTVDTVDLYLENLTGSAGFSPIPMTGDGADNYSVTVPAFADKSVLNYYIKIVDSEGTEAYFPPLAPRLTATFHVDDNPVSSADIVINEVLVNPPGTDNGTESEYIELYNKTSQPIDLSGFVIGRTLGDAYWRVIPDNTVIPANGFLVAVGRADLFDATWGATLDPSVVIVDLAWRRGLSVLVNGGTDLFLTHANAFNWNDEWAALTGVPFQQLDINLGANGWPTEADVVNISLELKGPELDPTVGSNWKPSTAVGGGTPGAPNSVSSVNDWTLY